MPTFYDLFREGAARWPDNVAVEFQRRDSVERHTYAELRRMAESIGRWLTEQGLARGDRAAILALNQPRWAASYLGIISAGGVVVPLDATLHAEQIAKLLKDSGSSWLFCDAKNLDAAAEAAADSGIKIVLLDGDGRSHGGDGDAAVRVGVEAALDEIFAAGPGDFRPASPADEDLAVLLYTSGTTADPKGVMLTHANLLGELRAATGWANILPDDAVLGVLPLFHVLAQITNMVFPLVRGSRVVYLETLNSTELMRALAEREVTALSIVPQFFYLIHERIFKEVAARGRPARAAVRASMALTRFARRFGFNPGRLFFGKIHGIFGPKMRYLLSGGSRFDPKIARDFHALGLDILQAYGLTESTAAAFATSPGSRIVIGSVGPALAGVEAKIADAQFDEGVGREVGEIAIRGALVMKGYWNRPEATAAVIKDGWLHTGDLGYLDAGGNLFITGRKKEVIILSNGKNVYPEEVEAHYLKAPSIKEICVLGLEARPGDPSSERLHGVVVPDFDVLRGRKVVNTKEVIRFQIEGLSVQIAPAKRLGSYEIWQEDLPRTTTRKVKRFEVARRVRANQSKAAADGVTDSTDSAAPLSVEDAEWAGRPGVARALALVRDAARNKGGRVLPDSNLELDLGFDSLQRVELVVALEQELGGRAEASRLTEVYTVRQLVDLIREGAAGAAGASEGASAPARFVGWDKVLREEPAGAEVLALARRQSVREAFWYALTRAVGLVTRVLFRLRVSGLERVPRRGPFLICPNHQSVIDGIVMSAVLPWPLFREVFFVGTSEFFGSKSLRVLARWCRVVVVDPDANLIPAMRAASYGLRHGRVLMLYPEGERSTDGTPKTFKKGAAILSIHLQVPIVPVAIEGFHDAWPRGKSFQRFARLRVKFGEPIRPPAEASASGAAYEALTAELKARVVEMWEELRRGSAGGASEKS